MKYRFSKCERCGGDTEGCTKVSYFNTETICMSCVAKERAHPKYAEATRVECEAVKQGNYNFPGIGLPVDL